MAGATFEAFRVPDGLGARIRRRGDDRLTARGPEEILSCMLAWEVDMDVFYQDI